jgi:hypothetical protein
MKKRRCHTRHAQYASPVDITARCTRLEFQKSSRGRLNSICDLFELCWPERASKSREMKLQKKTSRSQHVYLFV